MNDDKIPGTVFRAHRSAPSLSGVWYVFVPDSYFLFNGHDDCDPSSIKYSTFDEETFRISRWPHLNAIANGCADGVRLMPDLDNLLPEEEEHTARFKIFVAVLDCAMKKFWGSFPR